MLKVLVIDDEQLILGIIKQVLTKFGFKVETVSNGKEGIQKFDRNHFDLVITDICMPDIDGNFVARHIRIYSKQCTPVIGISGTPWLVEAADFDKIIQKPFLIKLLIDSVMNLTAGSKSSMAD